jgi:DNA polymerase-4
MILHIDMDAFFASIEQQINPHLRGKPVIVGSRDKKYHTVVAAASYEAKAYGITSGMPSYEAFKICPHAEFVACDSARYTHVSCEILNLLQEFSPFVDHVTIDEFDLDIRGLEHIFGPPLELGKTIKRRIREAFGLNCSIGIAPTWILAKLGTKIRKPDGLILINENNLDALIQGLGIEKICGIGPALTSHLAGLGILTCDQLKTVPENVLIANFGRTVGHWLYQALRTDENCRREQHTSTIFAKKASTGPFHLGQVPNKHWVLACQEGETGTTELPKSIGHSYTLPTETHDRKIVFSWLRMLSEMVAQRARKNRCQGKTISLWINSRNESFIRQRTFSIPTNDGWEIFMRSKAIFGQKKGIFRPARALGVTLSSLVFDEAPPLLFEQKRREALLMAQDKINAKYGDWTISPAVLARILPE